MELTQPIILLHLDCILSIFLQSALLDVFVLWHKMWQDRGRSTSVDLSAQARDPTTEEEDVYIGTSLVVVFFDSTPLSSITVHTKVGNSGL